MHVDMMVILPCCWVLPNTFVKHVIFQELLFDFQPAEEGHGGAKVMLDEGLFKRYNVSEVYAIHNMPGIKKGKFAINRGAMMAAADTFFISIKGTGAHGAYPHEGVDPIITAAQIVQALYSIISREIAPHKNVVMSITQINAGTASNIIPETVDIVGTVRTLDIEDAKLVEKDKEISQNMAQANNGTAELIMSMDILPPLMTLRKQLFQLRLQAL